VKAWTEVPIEARRDVVTSAIADLTRKRALAEFHLNCLRHISDADPRIPNAEGRVERLDRAIAAVATLPTD
jgi:hypothetical protein